ncbi:Stf0 sulfotransferase [Hwanghaeella grinnelliae]|uniref:Stf0 sulfotransferase n=1 Tax=Hwanghaeella grinnelliae TaxID=2500179 RepID=A0A3S3UQE7_9PROT|nr:Stf0 family sulfotransferase [Hwanghaeella grinnelliae]RVU38124.1 Stf0 sulfotransferase [Hwanghaeella grinnelliae]
MKSFIICATPRTGSTLLCDLLSATGRTGKPDSYFMGDMDPEWWVELGMPQPGMPKTGTPDDPAFCAAVLKAAIAAGKGDTDIFGLRLMRKDLPGLSAMIGTVHPGLTADRERLGAAFGDVLYIHLTREDKLAQAVSMVKAEQTGLWHIAPDGTEVERLAPPSDPVFDFDRIAVKLAELDAYDTAWTDWFAEQGIDRLRVGYENLSEDPATPVGRICDALQVPAPARGTLKPGVAKLADAVSLDWMRRFRAKTGPAAQTQD